MFDFFHTLKNILFLDIETASAEKNYSDLSERLRKAWNHKASLIDPEADPAALYFLKAGIYAEFGKIIAISTGFFYLDENKKWSFKVKCFSSDSEPEILSGFIHLIEEKYLRKKLIFCAHNGKEFDYPYLCRRMLINGFDLPKPLSLTGKKPWEIIHLDTLELWKFGDRKNYTSLDLLTAVFGIQSSKEELDGSLVNEVYYNQNGLSKIAKYCCEDALATAQLYLKLHNKPLIPEENIVRI
ncbi:MAG TPA: 3'-5' exonuclease [Cytophagaceae bacterium]|nr:3'-5' exonuclease [Cytophagaceae bacterium]